MNFITGLVVVLVLSCDLGSASPVKQRISARKCTQYKGLKTVQHRVGGLIKRPTAMITNGTLCDSIIGLVFGGEEAKRGEFPHMAAIGYKKDSRNIFGCGGSLISERFVLTAAHCKNDDRLNETFVRLGALNKTQTTGRDFSLVTFITHENYNKPKLHNNDIAVIKLNETVSFDPPFDISPACLWQAQEINENSATATGWGRTTNQKGSRSDVLMKVQLNILESGDCSYTFTDLDLVFSSDSQICSGVMTGGSDTCRGDSGGPLQVPDSFHQCVSHIIGVTSYGPTTCGVVNKPGVYTRVSAYLDWIEDKVWGGEN